MKRSEFIGSPSAVESPELPEPTSATEIPGLSLDSRASLAIGGEEETRLNVISASPEAPPIDELPSDVPQQEVPADELRSGASRADSGGASAVPSATGPQHEKNAEMIVVWRPGRSAFSRRRTDDRDQAPRSEHSQIEPTGRPVNVGRDSGAAGRGRNRRRGDEPPPSSMAPKEYRIPPPPARVETEMTPC